MSECTHLIMNTIEIQSADPEDRSRNQRILGNDLVQDVVRRGGKRHLPSSHDITIVQQGHHTRLKLITINEVEASREGTGVVHVDTKGVGDGGRLRREGFPPVEDDGSVQTTAQTDCVDEGSSLVVELAVATPVS